MQNHKRIDHFCSPFGYEFEGDYKITVRNFSDMLSMIVGSRMIIQHAHRKKIRYKVTESAIRLKMIRNNGSNTSALISNQL